MPLEYDLHALVLPLVITTVAARVEDILVASVQCVGISVGLVQQDLEEFNHALLGAHMHVRVECSVVDAHVGIELLAYLRVSPIYLETFLLVAQIGVLFQLRELGTHLLV